MNFGKETEKLLHFIDESPTAFQAVKIWEIWRKKPVLRN